MRSLAWWVVWHASGSGLGGHAVPPPPSGRRALLRRDDATRPLGSRTIPLKFVVTRLDSLAGARVAVTGLLIGADGADGINVTTVTRVAQKCP